MNDQDMLRTGRPETIVRDVWAERDRARRGEVDVLRLRRDAHDEPAAPIEHDPPDSLIVATVYDIWKRRGAREMLDWLDEELSVLQTLLREIVDERGLDLGASTDAREDDEALDPDRTSRR